jgi:hypothetical protein
MVWRWLSGLFGGSGPPEEPPDDPEPTPRPPRPGRLSAEIPTLYPDLGDEQLSRFLDEAEYRRLLQVPIVTVLPLFDKRQPAEQRGFAAGVARLLIRDLMLVPGLSVRGPEDTPRQPLESVKADSRLSDRGVIVGGTVRRGGEGWTADLKLHSRDRQYPPARVTSAALNDFARKCALAVAEALGVEVPERARAGWKHGRPGTPGALTAFGRLCLELDPRGNTRQAARLWEQDPDFVLPLHLADDSDPAARPLLLEGLRRDPCDAQLCFTLFCNVWKSRGPQPDAVQFVRRAVELSPGHGKAHMCAPHAAHPAVDMLRHSELAYRLLPGNSFAVNNYLLRLRKTPCPAETLLALVNEGIEADPEDPGSYERGIELFSERGEYDYALALAQRLQRLYAPRMASRTRYCLEQNPVRAQLLRSGRWDPAAENGARIRKLRQLARPG